MPRANKQGDALTGRQRSILTFLIDYQQENGNHATVKEICERFGFASLNGAAIHLKALEQKGYVSRGEKNTSRNIRILMGPNGKPLTAPTGLTRESVGKAVGVLQERGMLSGMRGAVVDVLCESFGVE